MRARVPNFAAKLAADALRTTERRLREATHKLVDQVTDLEIESWVSDRDTHRRLFDEKYALEEHVRQLQMTIAIMRETGRISLTDRDNAALVAAGRRRRSEPRAAAEATITPAPAPMQALPAKRQRGQAKPPPRWASPRDVRVTPPATVPLQLPFRGLSRPEEDEG